jgi:hypothetical protein
MKPTQRAGINAFLISGFVVALIILGIAWLFHPSWSTWASPWMWGTLLLMWFIGAGQVYNTCLQEQILKSVSTPTDHPKPIKPRSFLRAAIISGTFIAAPAALIVSNIPAVKADAALWATEMGIVSIGWLLIACAMRRKSAVTRPIP